MFLKYSDLTASLAQDKQIELQYLYEYYSS